MVRIDAGFIVVPARVWAIVEPLSVRLDYDYVNSTKLWRLHAQKQIPVTFIHTNDILAMKVAKKLEE